MPKYSVRGYLESIVFRSVVIGTLILVCVFFATRPIEYDAHDKHPHEPTKSEISDQFLGIGPEGWTAIFTGVLTVATLALAGVAAVQITYLKRADRTARITAKAALKSANVAERALIATERAFVFVVDFDLDFAFHPGSGQISKLRIRPIWKNSGSTATRDMKIRVNWTSYPWLGTPENIGDFRVVPFTRMFLGPQAREWSEGIEIPPNLATEAAQGISAIYIWGRVDYRDIFDDTPPRFTQWCNRLSLTRNGPEILHEFVSFGPYNQSDEDNRS